MPYSGEIASLLAALTFTFTTFLFARAGRRVGAMTVNLLRLGVALPVMVILNLVLVGSVFPFGAGIARFAWLGVSGLIGFALGDALLFEAYVLLGPRLAVLTYTIWPAMAALMAWAFLGQDMGMLKIFGMVVTLGGIAMVVGEKGKSDTPLPRPAAGPRRLTLGLLLGLGGAAGQAVGFILAKFGMTGDFSPVSANLIRVCAGTLGFWIWQGCRGELVPSFRKLRDTGAALLIALAALIGPVLGVVLCLYAINHAHSIGVASTLMSLSPVLILPISVFIEKERVGLAAVVGTVITIGGAAAMFLT